jgi:uncharacterized membrane-anchored protein
METDCQAMDLATNKSLWDAYADQFKSELRQGNFASASRTLESALSDAEEFRHIDPVLIWCVNSLSGHYCAHGDYQAAIRLLTLGLETKEKVLGRHHGDVVNSLEKLALVQLRVLAQADNTFDADRAAIMFTAPSRAAT